MIVDTAAHLVCASVGLNVAGESVPYVAGWGEDGALEAVTQFAKNGQQSHAGDYLNIWTCHGPNGEPNPGGPTGDTQNFTLEHPDPYQPNLTMIRDNATNQYANVLGDAQGDGPPSANGPTSPAPVTNTSTFTPKSPNSSKHHTGWAGLGWARAEGCPVRQLRGTIGYADLAAVRPRNRARPRSADRSDPDPTGKHITLVTD
ncbi:MAG: cytolethal distending toxin subunit [Solirubrobacteraceae bacterium]|nr:cytolethal distending toxin subunit [Solirubrobacteraceae bacterium]